MRLAEYVYASAPTTAAPQCVTKRRASRYMHHDEAIHEPTKMRLKATTSPMTVRRIQCASATGSRVSLYPKVSLWG